MVLLVLAVLWMLVLVPPVLRARVEARRRDHERGADAARRELSLVTSPSSEATSTSQDAEAATLATATILATATDPVEPSIDPAPRRLPSLGVQRRRQGLFANLALMAITFLAGLVKTASGDPGGWIWRLHLASHLLLLGYLLALALVGSRRKRTAVVEANVRYFPATPRLEPDEIGGQPLRRSASS